MSKKNKRQSFLDSSNDVADGKDMDTPVSFKDTMPRLIKKKREALNINPEKNEMDTLSADFRAQLGILEEEEQRTTDAFRNHLGLHGLEEVDNIKLGGAPKEEDFMNDPSIDQYDYKSFINEHFQNPQDFQFTTSFIEKPLLHHKDPFYNNVAIYLWAATQLFLETVKRNPISEEPRSKSSIMTKVHFSLQTARKNFENNTANETIPKIQVMETVKVETKSSFKKILGRMASNEKASTKRKESMMRKDESLSYLDDWISYRYPIDMHHLFRTLKMDEIELLQFIIGHGILRPPLRNEIFCQILRQISGNESESSMEKGAILLGLSLACFEPSAKLQNYMKNIIKKGLENVNKERNEWLRLVFQNTLKKGPRYHPPGKLEFDWVKQKTSISIKVVLPDKRQVPIGVDSTTTTNDVCQEISNLANITDRFGFSLYLLVDDRRKILPRQVTSMGSGSDHIMDALAEFEDIRRQHGRHDDDVFYRFYYRKEVFPPFYEPSCDLIAMEYIYCQMKYGIKSHEYGLQTESDRIDLVSKIMYIDKGGEIDLSAVASDMTNYVFQKTFKSKNAHDIFANKLKDTLSKEVRNNIYNGNYQQMKEDLILDFVERWSLQFSAFFEVCQISGASLPQSFYIMAINHKCVSLMNDFIFEEAVNFPYYKIVDITHSRDDKIQKIFTLHLLNGESYMFETPITKNIVELISIFLEGLRRRSRYAIGIEDFSMMGKDGIPFKFSKGDFLLMLESSPDNAPDSGEWVYGMNYSTKAKGRFPLDMVYVLPTIQQPDDKFIKEIKSMKNQLFKSLPGRKGKIVLQQTTLHRPRDKRSKLFYSDA